MIQEFKDFINKGSIVELAVAVVMATAFAPVIGAFVDGILMQFVAMIFGEPDFSRLTFTLSDTDYGYGLVITAIVNFVFVALAVFFVLKAYNSSQAPEDEADSGPSEVDLLTEIRDSLAKS